MQGPQQLQRASVLCYHWYSGMQNEVIHLRTCLRLLASFAWGRFPKHWSACAGWVVDQRHEKAIAQLLHIAEKAMKAGKGVTERHLGEDNKGMKVRLQMSQQMG
ncbi:hypothetical protein ONS95_013638 [Cadophora gregata]|uniref:uncharacterized protein n=1 Tax=Cadophora gregata TaxID=51156 RepID=UPI0026DAE3F2|nr:uncharacterized protein ONS95_013638 [Cadophora gregata]KAK0114137.1 hypothetical protein ONS95_013638 [Cadophora gregata]